MSRVSGFRRVRYHGRLVAQRCKRCSTLVSPYFTARHHCPASVVAKTVRRRASPPAVPKAKTPARETQEDLRLQCWESGFAAGRIQGRCPCCSGSRIRYKSTSGTTFQMMHVIPRSRGGPAAAWNLLPGCGCNQNMQQMNLLDWMGTRGNKRQLLRTLVLRKYKSLVPPVMRSASNARQLIEWVQRLYAPQRLGEYEEWMLLLESDLACIFD